MKSSSLNQRQRFPVTVPIRDGRLGHLCQNSTFMAKSSTRRVTIYINGKEEDASGWQTFSYGKLGEVTENIRTFAPASRT